MNIAQTIPLADTWGMHGGDVGTGWWIVMMIFMVLFWAAVILGIVWLIRGASPWQRPAAKETPKETPVETLERRFAEGAISEEDYLARRNVLVSGATHSNGTDKDDILAPAGAGEGRRS